MVQKHCKLFFFNNPSLPHTFILLMFLITFPPKNKSLQRIISEALPKMNTHTHTLGIRATTGCFLPGSSSVVQPNSAHQS